MTIIAETQREEKESILHLKTSPIHIKGILSATDLSESATRALKVAARLAKHLHSRLHVLHAIAPQVYVPGGAGLTPLLHEVDIKEAKAALHKYVVKVPEVRVLKHEELIVCEPPTDAIASAVETKGIDLVVMGSHGRGGLGKLLLGSNAEAAIRRLHCPILVVGPHCRANHGSLKSLVLATELPTGTLRATQYAMGIVQAFGCNATLVHVLTAIDRNADSIEAEKSEAMKQLRQLVPAEPELARRVRCEVAVGNRAEQIVDTARECRAGLIVMGVREHQIFADHAPWATLSEVIRTARCPVLAVSPHLV